MKVFLSANRGGFIIMGVVFAMLIFVLMAITGVAMLANQSQTSISVLRLAQANAIRLGVLEFVQKRLQDDLNWSDNPASENIVLDGQTTVVNYVPAPGDPNRVDVNTTTDAVLDANRNLTARRLQRLTLYRLPQASHYSFFSGNRSGRNGSVTLDGTMRHYAYVNPSITGINGALADAVLYYSGAVPGLNLDAGLVTRRAANPQPNMPFFDSDSGVAGNAYDARIAAYDTDIQNAFNQGKGPIRIILNAGTYTQANLEALENPADAPADGVVEASDFSIETAGNVIFDGPIKIVAHGNIYLQADVPGACRFESTAYKTSDGGCKKITGANRTVWSQNQATGGGMAWAAANGVCNNLSEGGYSAGAGFRSWRLPTVAELQTATADIASTNPFTFNTPNQRFWSSEQAPNVNEHWAVDTTRRFPQIPPEAVADSANLAVVCVRSNVNNVQTTGSLELRPGSNGGSGIEFVAGGSIIRSDDTRYVFNNQATVDPIYFYARNRDSSTNAVSGQMYITESAYPTAPRAGLHNGYAMANETLFVGPGSVFTRFLLYMPGTVPFLDWVTRTDNTTGVLTVAGTDRGNGIARVSGAILSMSEADPNMIFSNAATEGLAYSGDVDADIGSLLLWRSSHDGSVIANHLWNDQMWVTDELAHTPVTVGGSVVFRTDHTFMPESRVIDGFTGSVSVKESSWSAT